MFFEFEYLDGKYNQFLEEGKIEKPLLTSKQQEEFQGAKSIIDSGGNLIEDKRKEIFKELYAINRAIELNEDVASKKRSRTQSFVEGLSEATIGAVGGKSDRLSKEEVARSYVNALKRGGVNVTKEEEDRVDKERDSS